MTAEELKAAHIAACNAFNDIAADWRSTAKQVAAAKVAYAKAYSELMEHTLAQDGAYLD